LEYLTNGLIVMLVLSNLYLERRIAKLETKMQFLCKIIEIRAKRNDRRRKKNIS